VSRIPYHKRYHGDILTAYMGMSLEERGAYDTLLELMYDRGGDVPNDPRWLAGWFGVSLRKANLLITTLLDKHKIYLSAAGTFRNRRADNELENLAKTSRIQAERRIKPQDNSHENTSASNSFNDLQEPPLIGGLTYQKPDTRNQIEPITTNTITPTAARVENPEKNLALVPELGKRIFAEMGVLDDPNWQGTWQLVQVWLSRGYDPDLDIMPGVRMGLESLKRRGEGRPGSLRYFSKIIEANHRERTQLGAPAAAAASQIEYYVAKKGTPEFRAWIAHYKARGKPTKGYENMDFLSVPTKFPPSQASAA
jgi:uncharacterized protein YdaU (DUF1376 family)